jgi:hypothetical protein
VDLDGATRDTYRNAQTHQKEAGSETLLRAVCRLPLGKYTFLTKSPDKMKSITLLNTHYAARWKTEGMIKSLPEINDLGRYGELPAETAGISNPAKQALLLELCQCFHPYLMKYLVMICRGMCRFSASARSLAT